MTIVPTESETRIAVLKRVRPDLLEIHYRPGSTFTPQDVAEVQDKRRSMMGERSYATLTIIPEDADFTLETMRVDHSGADRGSGRVIATAIVVRSTLIERLTHVYFNYYPQFQRLLVTDSEEEARKWMEAQLEEIGRTGS